MEPEQSTGTSGWPAPHPSPPAPPPREYGTPGRPRDLSWIWLALGGVVALVAAVAFGAWLFGTGSGAVDDAGGPAGVDTPTAVPTSVAGTTPVASEGAPIRCWDGSGEEALDDCSLPDGEAGLAWLFPQLAQQKCGRATATGPGVVVRILCTMRLSDGSRITVGYYQWESVQAGADFYDGQGLVPGEAAGFRSWTGNDGDSLKGVLLYVDAPFSETVTLPAGVEATDPGLAVLQPRAPKQLRGEPVG